MDSDIACAFSFMLVRKIDYTVSISGTFVAEPVSKGMVWDTSRLNSQRYARRRRFDHSNLYEYHSLLQGANPFQRHTDLDDPGSPAKHTLNARLTTSGWGQRNFSSLLQPASMRRENPDGERSKCFEHEGRCLGHFLLLPMIGRPFGKGMGLPYHPFHPPRSLLHIVRSCHFD